MKEFEFSFFSKIILKEVICSSRLMQAFQSYAGFRPLRRAS
jgi:hypothetical protein